MADGIASVAYILASSEFWGDASAVCTWCETGGFLDWGEIADEVTVRRE
jgi:hypothetical protein